MTEDHSKQPSKLPVPKFLAPKPPAAENGTEPAAGNTQGNLVNDGESVTPASSDAADVARCGPDEMGETGNSIQPTPVSPVLGSPSAQSAPNLVPAVDPGDVADHVYTPAPKLKPVVAALKLARLYLGPRDDGGHWFTCHKTAEHPPEASAKAVYFEPTTNHPYGRCVCAHHAEQVRIEGLLDHLGIPLAEARGKARIRLHPGQTYLAVAAADRLMAEGPFYRANGSIVRISEEPDGRVSVQRLTEHTLSPFLAAGIHWEHLRGGRWDHCEPARQVVQQVLVKQDSSHIRRLEGVARQPFLRPDGTLVTRPGYDPETGIYAAFSGEEYVFGIPTEDTARRALTYLDSLLEGFPFAKPADRSAAVSLLLTGVARATLTQAPAWNITAPLFGSGKSFLATLGARFASPDPPYSASYPTTADEAAKLMLAILSEKPSAVVFDDMQDDWLAHGPMNMVLTSPSITGRILGESRMSTVRTNCLFIGTGNDIEPVGDMRRRVVSIRLEPADDTPALRRFQSDPLAEVRNNRARAVMAALEIIRAYQAAGKPTADVTPIGTYEEWSTWCRQPLLWLGLPDPATSLIKQVNQDSGRDARWRFLSVWYERFESDPMLVKEIIEAAGRYEDLMDAVSDLPVMSGSKVNAKKLGWFLKTKCQRPVGGLKVEPCDAPRQRIAWRVVRLGGGPVQGVARADGPDETGEMGDRRFRPFSDGDDWPPGRPRKKAYAG